MEHRFVYEAIFEDQPDGVTTVDFPDLEGCFTAGRGLEHTAAMASEALEVCLAEFVEAGTEAPTPVFDRVLPEGARRVLVAVTLTDEQVQRMRYMTTAEAAEALGVTTARVRAMVKDGILEGYREGRDHRIDPRSVELRAANPPKGGRPRKGERR